MKLLYIHAHFDDYEFTASGTFDRTRQRLGEAAHTRVLVCTDGRAGHHILTTQETTERRLQEQKEAAAIGGFDFAWLRLPNGEVPREACLLVSRELLAALWKAIRDYEPDYIFCPPLPTDNLAGVHVDHVALAEAVRKVAYMINVPHAFTEEYPKDERQSAPCKVPVILNTYDTYMAGANAFDFAVDVEDSFELIKKLSWCHQSQIMEWLPWVGRHKMHVPDTFDAWGTLLRERFIRQNRELGIDSDHAVETFTVTAWGEIPTIDQLQRDFPNWMPDYSRFHNAERFLKATEG